ncbi:MAG: glycogen/starch/alpha-glucan phosphorylase [Clostridia bacterium]|nr:glycogen/starch/alpha-glucan phosphorylase [Clostridia bacterium]
MVNREFNTLEISELLESNATRFFGLSVKELDKNDCYKAIAMTVRDILLEKRRIFNREFKSENKKRVYYLSMEFLLGRSLKNNIFNLNIEEQVRQSIRECSYTLEDLYEEEPDAGLGNGGLGRLAAAYMDALATSDYPAMGHCLRYEYGLFKQKLVDGWQTELPDNWLPGGEVWLVQRPEKAVTVKFGGFVKETNVDGRLVFKQYECQEIEALPYDMMISGYDSNAVSVLRLWRARNKHNFDMKSFSQGDYQRAVKEDIQAELITKVLYPNDNHAEGKSLRLKQQYLLASAAIQNIIGDHIDNYGDISTLPLHTSIHINDTHAALCIPELMRILLDEYSYGWDDAWNIVINTCAYTNHTVLSEALEVWPEDLIARVLPRLYSILHEINERFCRDAYEKCHDLNKVSRMAVVAYGQIRMANLSVIGSKFVNGVSELHSEILKKSLFYDFYTLNPKHFGNVTNGITHRRWLCQSNPKLASLIGELIGNNYIKNPSELIKLEKYVSDEVVLDRLAEIKKENKLAFSDYAKRTNGYDIDPDTRFDVHVKRLHEYKRQLLNVLEIISTYIELRDNPNMDITPQTYIFGAKAAPGYYTAKDVIKLIYMLGEEIKKQPSIRSKLNVVFLENYCVTMAEKLIPSAEISRQISLAGKEASGTGNMKFMLNGAITVGTMDGANVEMYQKVGANNIYIFGLREKEVEDLWKSGYNSTSYYLSNPKLRGVVDALNVGFNGVEFSDIANYLLRGTGVADPYMCFADFKDYARVCGLADEAYRDKTKWNRMSLINIANAGQFSADRAIEEYATKIWKLDKVPQSSENPINR